MSLLFLPVASPQTNCRLDIESYSIQSQWLNYAKHKPYFISTAGIQKSYMVCLSGSHGSVENVLFRQNKQNINKRKNGLQLNYTGEKESCSWSLFMSTLLNHVCQIQIIFNMICVESRLHKHHLQKVMSTNTVSNRLSGWNKDFQIWKSNLPTRVSCIRCGICMNIYYSLQKRCMS